MGKLEVRLLKHTRGAELDRYLRLYSRSFNPDERVSPQVLRWVIQPSPARVNPVHLFAAYLDKRLVGGALHAGSPHVSGRIRKLHLRRP